MYRRNDQLYLFQPGEPGETPCHPRETTNMRTQTVASYFRVRCFHVFRIKVVMTNMTNMTNKQANAALFTGFISVNTVYLLVGTRGHEGMKFLTSLQWSMSPTV